MCRGTGIYWEGGKCYCPNSPFFHPTQHAWVSTPIWERQWTDNRQGKSFSAATGEAPSDFSHWPDGFRWFVTVVDQNQCRIRAWAEHYRSLDQLESTQGVLSLLD